MKKLLILFTPTIIFAMDPVQPEDTIHYPTNTYRNELITPALVTSQKMREEFPIPENVAHCVQDNRELLSQLSETPNPLDTETLNKKMNENKKALQQKQDEGVLTSMSNHNYVMEFKEYPDHVIRINHPYSRMLCWLSEIGINIFLPETKKPFYYAQLQYLPAYQGLSVCTYYLAWKEFERQHGALTRITTPPTYAVPIPKKSDDNVRTMYPAASDHNYVVAQKKVEGFEELKGMTEEQQKEVISAWEPETIKQLFAITVACGIWDMRNNVGIVNGDPNKLCMLDLEQSIFHNPSFIHYQGDEGNRLHALDSYMGQLRIAQLLLIHNREKFELWKKLYYQDNALRAHHKKYKDDIKKCECYINLKNEEELRKAKLYR